MRWDDAPPPRGPGRAVRGLAALLALGVGAIAATLWLGDPPPPAPAAARTGATGAADTPGLALGVDGDGREVHLEAFAGHFLWVDLEGPWCPASAAQGAVIRRLGRDRDDVGFLTLVTSDGEPGSPPTRDTARAWAARQGLPPERVAAYPSSATVPHHVLYSPRGEELLRHTGPLGAAELEALLAGAARRWGTTPVPGAPREE
ncbi:MAG TPA: hypothetical protein VK997_06910 [Deferrisomatales bacterium]|nr:hypothetical protein [Deferrisomatales bacterium]